MKLSDHEINSALRERLQMPTGRHLYAILGSYVALERYERVSLSQALGADGKTSITSMRPSRSRPRTTTAFVFAGEPQPRPSPDGTVGTRKMSDRGDN